MVFDVSCSCKPEVRRRRNVLLGSMVANPPKYTNSVLSRAIRLGVRWWQRQPVWSCVACAVVFFSTVPMCTPVQAEFDRKIAVLVGVGNYGDKGVFPPLPVLNDLLAMSDALDGLGFEINIFSDLTPPSNWKWYENRKSLGPRGTSRIVAQDLVMLVKNSVTGLASASGTKLLLFYFTGHGGMFGASTRVLAGPESSLQSTDSFVVVKDILDALAGTDKSITPALFVDACANTIDPSAQHDRSTPRWGHSLPVYFFSSQDNTSSYIDSTRNMSVFTYYLAQALSSPKEYGIVGASGKIESEELRIHLRRRVPAHTALERKRGLNGFSATGTRHQVPIASDRQDLSIALPIQRPYPPTSPEDDAMYIRANIEIYYGDQ